MRFIGHWADSSKERSRPVPQANPRQLRDSLKLENRQALPGMWERPKPPNFWICPQARCGSIQLRKISWNHGNHEKHEHFRWLFQHPGSPRG